MVQSNTTEAEKAANEANKHSENGQKVVDETISSMQSLAGQVDTTHSKIEAARAGEQGRGFAVVADEVRALSQDVQKETDRVDTQIAELQNAVSETFKSMALSKEQTEVNVGGSF